MSRLDSRQLWGQLHFIQNSKQCLRLLEPQCPLISVFQVKINENSSGGGVLDHVLSCWWGELAFFFSSSSGKWRGASLCFCGCYCSDHTLLLPLSCSQFTVQLISLQLSLITFHTWVQVASPRVAQGPQTSQHSACPFCGLSHRHSQVYSTLLSDCSVETLRPLENQYLVLVSRQVKSPPCEDCRMITLYFFFSMLFYFLG